MYPLTGVKNLPTDTSFAQGTQILDATIQNQIATGDVDAANPVVAFGWSQSSTIAGMTMTSLAGQNVPSDDVRFVLVGDPSAPNGGLLERFDVPAGTSPSFPSLGITFSGATPSDLYPTDIYTIEYDGFADFPQYPLNFISDLNAIFGIIFAHTEYFGLTADQIESVADGGDAIQLATSDAATLTDYYMIPNAELPLLVPLQLLPVIGQPLYDLLEPDMRVLVNLGYGSITEGWSQGDADVPTTFGLFPSDLDVGDVLAALGSGLQSGIGDAAAQLQDPTNYQITPVQDLPGFATLFRSLELAGLGSGSTDTGGTTPLSLTDLVNEFSGALSNGYATLLPTADTLNAIITGLPLYDANVFIDELGDGNLLDAIGLPIAADVALVPFAVAFGVVGPLATGLSGVSI